MKTTRFFYGYIVVGAALFITIVIWSAYYSFGVFFKPVLGEFGWTRAMTSGAFSLSMIIFGVMGIVMGGLNDRLGPRLVMSICGVLLGLGYFLMSQLNNVWQLYIFYGILIGIGMGGAWVPLPSTIARWFKRKRNTMTGFVLAGTGIGALFGPLVASRLIFSYDWRVSYIILGSTVLIGTVLVAQFLRKDASQVDQLPNVSDKGGGQKKEPGKEGLSLRETICTSQFWAIFSVFFCFGFCMLTVMVHIIPLITDMEITVTSAAHILSTIGALMIVGRIMLGISADKIGNREALMVSLILISIAMFFLVTSTKIWMYYLFAVIFGLAVGGIGTLESPLIAEFFGLRSHGLIFGVVDLGFAMGAAIGPYMAGYIFDITRTYQIAFIVCIVLSIFAVLLAAFLKPVT